MYFSGACCDKLQVHSKEKEAFSHSRYAGDFLFQETPEGDPWSAMRRPCSSTPMASCSSTGTRTVTGLLVKISEGNHLKNHPDHHQGESLETTRREFTWGARTRTAHPSSRSVPVRWGGHLISWWPPSAPLWILIPLQTKSWQKLEKESNKWLSDANIRVLIRQARVNFWNSYYY